MVSDDIAYPAHMKAVLRNPTLYPGALTQDELDPSFNWHGHSSSPRSSQVFCLSAFGTLRNLARKDRVLETFFRNAISNFPRRSRPRRWEIIPEAENSELLSEYGNGQATSIDVLCMSSKEVICIESKFATDAKEGFGGCSQFSNRKCKGYRGPGSYTATDAWCRLETWDGHRSPRTYWTIGTRYFRPEIFAMQVPGDTCALRGSNYQLMRNFLFAASLAERENKNHFGVVTIAPRKFSGHIRAQLAEFRNNVLLPGFGDHIGFIDYETYCKCLAGVGDKKCLELASFLLGRISEIIEGK